MKNVVVVGGAGFIGSHLVDALVQKGCDVLVVDNLSGGKRENINPAAQFEIADIRDAARLPGLLKRADTVFHLAALPRVQYSIEHPQETNDVNVTGTLNVLEAARIAGAKKVVYSASSSAYGDQPVMPLVETMPANPKSPYGLQKYIGELYCRVYSQVYGLSTVSLRYFNVYGPRFNAEGAYALVIGKFLMQTKEGKPMTITGDGTNTRDYTHVNDVVRANILAAEQDVAGGEVFNIGAGQEYSTNEVAKFIGTAIEYIPKRLEPKRTLADNRKARDILGWQPQIMLPEGIEDLKKRYL